MYVGDLSHHNTVGEHARPARTLPFRSNRKETIWPFQSFKDCPGYISKDCFRRGIFSFCQVLSFQLFPYHHIGGNGTMKKYQVGIIGSTGMVEMCIRDRFSPLGNPLIDISTVDISIIVYPVSLSMVFPTNLWIFLLSFKQKTYSKKAFKVTPCKEI